MTTRENRNRNRYQGMTAAQILRNMSDAELDRNVRRGGRDAILEQAYRHREPIRSVPELGEFKAAILGEADAAFRIPPDPELDIGV